jgi:type II secretory pathway pseudopilin PulG
MIRERGFTYLGLMFMVAVLGLTATMASTLWSTASQRDKERELVFAGQQIRQAIERYHQHVTGPEARYPRQLEDLLRDDRLPITARHLRRIYLDPITGQPEWGLVRRADGGIVGVHSLSDRKPMQGTTLAAMFGTGPDTTYREWRFLGGE